MRKLLVPTALALMIVMAGCGGATETETIHVAKDELQRAYDEGFDDGRKVGAGEGEAAGVSADELERAEEEGYERGVEFGEVLAEEEEGIAGEEREQRRLEKAEEALPSLEEIEEELELETSTYEGSGLNPYPLKKDGTRSYEFEPDDIQRAEEATPEVQEYCEGAVSEAQELGCLSHVDPWEVP